MLANKAHAIQLGTLWYRVVGGGRPIISPEAIRNNKYFTFNLPWPLGELLSP